MKFEEIIEEFRKPGWHITDIDQCRKFIEDIRKERQEIKNELENVLRICDSVECYHIGIAKVINTYLDDEISR